MNMKYINKFAVLIMFFATMTSCTDLTENAYSIIVSDNYYNSKTAVLRSAMLPFEHAFWSIGPRQVVCELSSDQIGTWARDGWFTEERWEQLHYHSWDWDHIDIQTEWEGCYKGIIKANTVIKDLQSLDPSKFGMTQNEMNVLIAQSMALKNWFYLRLLDQFRNVPLMRDADDFDGAYTQVTPKHLFDFIEDELKLALTYLPIKDGNNGNGIYQGQWNQAAVAALLVRLYLNAEKWIGEDRYSDCEIYANKIINGEYGFYELESTWDAVFDWKNDQSNEVIYAFTGSYGHSHWHYDGNMYWHTVPTNSRPFFKAFQQNDFNAKYAVQPSMDNTNQEFDFKLGKFVKKFQKYPNDYRLIRYKNLGNSSREGMFLFGYLDYEEDGQTKQVTSPVGNYILYLRDQVGSFQGRAPGLPPSKPDSNIKSGDFNSGWHFVKYPIYGDNEEGKKEADYVEIRLAEIIYSLAECKFRAGQVDEAAKLLNKVRKRNYPAANHEEYLYIPNGAITLTADEFLDEWGREFFAEGRRRTDLIRWNKFSSERWWDKQPDKGNYTEIFPIPRTVMVVSRDLKQNEGYKEF